MHLGDTLRERLSEIKRREHVAEQDGGGDDHQDHYRLPSGVAQDRPPLHRPPHPVDDHRQDHAERRADTCGLGGSCDSSVEHIHHADHDGEEGRNFRDGLKLLGPRITEVRRVGTKPALPYDEQRPQHEQPGEHESRQHSGEKEAPDRSFRRDPVENESDRRRDEDAQRASGANRAGRNVVGIAAPPHLGDAHFADGGAARRRRAGKRCEYGASPEVGDHQPSRQAIQPAIERFVEVASRG